MKLKKIALGLLAVLVLLQFVNTAPENKEIDTAKDFLAVNNAPENIAKIVTSACYDCHSNQTNYPWYSKVAPLSFWINHHVEEGREHLNFSEWTSYSAKRASHKLEEFYEEVEEDKMPLESYEILHGDLSKEDKKALLLWVKGL